MDLPAHRWFAAAKVRRSRRTFDPSPASTELLDSLEEVCRGFRPHPSTRVELVRAPEIDVFRGIVASYGRLVGSTSVLVIVTSDETHAGHRRMGYSAEGVILEATALGLDTCWVGGFFDPGKAKRILSLEPGERIAAVSPVGHALPDESGSEKAMRGLAGSHKRMQLDEIAPGSSAWPGWASAAVEAARIAPSATNRQPWRFAFEGDELVLSRDNAREWPFVRVSKALDCGIASLHAELGAAQEGVLGAWTDCADESGLEICRFTPRETCAP